MKPEMILLLIFLLFILLNLVLIFLIVVYTQIKNKSQEVIENDVRVR